MNPLIHLASPADLDELVAIDDDACRLFERAGLNFHFPPGHPALQQERCRWEIALQQGWVRLASIDQVHVGFCVWGLVDGLPYLDQISVRSDAQRRGVGARLIDASREWALARGETSLWLTTYAHFDWNGPYYERLGFRRVAEDACGPELRALLAEQRGWLPAPEQRIAMCRDL